MLTAGRSGYNKNATDDDNNLFRYLQTSTKNSPKTRTSHMTQKNLKIFHTYLKPQLCGGIHSDIASNPVFWQNTEVLVQILPSRRLGVSSHLIIHTTAKPQLGLGV